MLKRAEKIYHGTRVGEKKIRKEGLHAFGYINYLRAIKRALDYFNIPYGTAISDNLVRNELRWMESSKVVNNIWGTTIFEGACSYAERSPEKVYLVLSYLGVEDIKEYLEKEFGEPKVVVLRTPPEVVAYEGEINIPLGSYVSPVYIIDIIRC